MPDYFVCVDACVVIDLYVETIGTGAIPTEWDELKALVANGEAKLLVPEVTLMEFRKWVRKRLEVLPNTKFTVQPPSGNKSFDEVVNEQLTKVLQTPLNDWLKQTEPDWQAASEKVLNSLSNGIQIKFTPEVEHRTKRRLIEELYLKRPGKDDKRDQDCFIIDSLVDYFEKDHGGQVDDKILVFGTKDTGFGELKKETGTEMVDPTGMLDKSFQGGLPPTKLFTSLGDLVKFIKSKGTINFLAQPAAEEEETERLQVEEEVEEPAAAPVEAVIAVPAAGKVIEVLVRDHVAFSDSVAATTTTTTPPPDLEIAGGGWIHYGPTPSQRRADELARIRHDEERRRRNAAVHQLPPSFFSPPPQTKTAQTGADKAGPLAGQEFKRWVDPEGVAWQLTFTSYVPITGDQSAQMHVLVTLDRRNANSCTEDVSEACDRFLRTLRFSYQRVAPQRRLGGVSIGPYLEEVLDPERPQPRPEEPSPKEP